MTPDTKRYVLTFEHPGGVVTRKTWAISEGESPRDALMLYLDRSIGTGSPDYYNGREVTVREHDDDAISVGWMLTRFRIHVPPRTPVYDLERL